MTFANLPKRQGLPASAAGQLDSKGGLAAVGVASENLSEEVAAGSTPVVGTTAPGLVTVCGKQGPPIAGFDSRRGAIYTVASADCDLLQTSSLRRAWEAQRYFEESSCYGAMILNRNAADLDDDGLTGDEVAELESFDVWEGRKVAPVHLCVMRETEPGAGASRP